MRRRLARLAGTTAAALAVAAAAGCSPPEQSFAEYDHRLKHPVKVGTRTAGLVIEAPGEEGFSEADRRRLYDFATDFQARGTGMVEVNVQADGADDAAARRLLRRLLTALADDGVPAARLRPQLVLDGPVTAPRRAVLVARQHIAELPDCGTEHTYESNIANTPGGNFGCAVQRNIGAMVVNPRDLIQPHEASPPSLGRSVNTIRAYRQGGGGE